MTSKTTRTNPLLLLIDDDPDSYQQLTLLFQDADVSIQGARSGREGLQLLYEQQPDLVVLALAMAEMDSQETLAHIQEATDIPVLLLAKGNEQSAIAQGLELGAIDYLTKPFDSQLVVPRVMALLRFLNRRTEESTDGYRDTHLTVDLLHNHVFKQGDLLHLTNIERELFFYLVSRANRICTYVELLEHVWGAEYRESTHYVHIYISRLRRKIEVDPKQPRYLLKAYGAGYQFCTQQ